MNFTWQVPGTPPHTVVLTLNLLTGRNTITVDGVEVVSELSWTLSKKYDIWLGGERAEVVAGMGFPLPRGALRVRGREVEPVGGARRVPPWVWLFAAPCFAMPIVTLGGAIPGAIGFGAGAGVIAVGSNTDLPVAARVVLCAAIAVAAWLGLLALGVAVFAARR